MNTKLISKLSNSAAPASSYSQMAYKLWDECMWCFRLWLLAYRTESKAVPEHGKKMGIWEYGGTLLRILNLGIRRTKASGQCDDPVTVHPTKRI